MARKRHIPDALRQQVRDRAGGRCEYCLLHEDDVVVPHEADHLIAEQHAGPTTLDNLAWTCASCNRYKGPNLSSYDAATGRVVQLFNPRAQRWRRHFRLNGAVIEPLTAAGRVTVSTLHFNDERRITDRLIAMSIGHYPLA